MKRLIAKFVFWSVAVISFVPHVALASDPSIEWKTIETPHFSLIFDSKQQRIAEIYALKAEQAFAAISPTFGVWPEKTVIYLDDSTDRANGSATPWPYPTINAYPVLPLSNEVVGAYGDWGLELLTHEYTHILNFTPANGVMKPLRSIFGTIIAPNALLPRWYSEGLAVEMETRYSKFGRLRSSGFLSIARAMAAEGKLRDEDIGRINESIPDFPGGNRPYLMGALIWDELTRKAGDKIIGDLNTAYSRRVPFFLNGPLHDRLGLKWKDVLDDAYTRVEKRTLEQIRVINAAGEMKERLVARDGYYSRSAAFSPNGQMLAFVSQTVNTDDLVMLAHREGSSFTGGVRTKRLVEGVDINRIAWLPDSSGFIYDAIDTVNRYYSYSDLYRCDLDGDRCKVKKLTRALRAREPVVSPDGKSLVFVQNTTGSTRIVASHVDGSAPRVLFEPPVQTRVSNPTFVSEDELVFSERRSDGNETLRMVHLKENASGEIVFSSQPLEILTAYAPARLPSMTSKGLTFISDKSGASNLFLADAPLKTARALTNTISRVIDATVDDATGDVLYSRIEASGAALFALSPTDAVAVPATPPTVGALLDTTYPGWDVPNVKPEMTVDDYHPSRWLLPRYWFPYAYILPGGFYAQASTSGEDPVGRHAYSLTGAYDSLSGKPSVFGSYLNATQKFASFLFVGEDVTETLYSSGLERKTTAGSATASFYLPELSNKWRGLLGWEYLQTVAQSALTVRNGADVGFGYTNVSQRGYQISPESGGSASVLHRHYFESLGNIGYDETDVSASKYLNWLLPDHHVAAFFTNFAWAPALNRTILGRSTVGGNYQNGLIQNAFVMRGYQSGVFLGKDMLTGTFEYRFPLLYSYRSFGTAPLFFRRLHASVFLDAITLDGVAYREDLQAYQRETFGTFHLGTGLELKADTTLFYFLPVQFIVGAYYGIDRVLNQNGVFPFIGLGI
jgi:Tol biopolymer transport system component